MLSYTGPLWIPGHPVTKGSMRCITPHTGGRRGILVPEKTLANPDDWHNRVPQVLALKARRLLTSPLDGPIELIADFHIAKPKTTKFGDAPTGHGTGDLDKLLRALGDAVTTSGIITDDSRITRIIAEKIYATAGEGAMVELRPYTPPPVNPHGPMPVRIQAGRLNTLVGSISDVRGLPNLLRKVADQIEATSHAI